MAQQATKRIVLSSEAAAQTNTDFDKEKREIRILFVVRVRNDAHTMGTCTERRVIFRLGRMFTKEPADHRDSVQAMGERIAQSTYLQMNVYDSAGNKPITCGGHVTDLKGG